MPLLNVKTSPGNIFENVSPAFSESDGTRTRNYRIDSPLQSAENAEKTMSCKSSAAHGAAVDFDGAHHDTDLQLLIERWPILPESIKAALLAIVHSVVD